MVDRLKMIRVHAASIATEVVEFSTVRNRAAKCRKNNAMGDGHTSVNRDLTVAASVDRAGPLPAARRDD